MQLLTFSQSDQVSTISPLAANHAMASTTQHAGQFPKLRSYCNPLAGGRWRQYPTHVTHVSILVLALQTCLDSFNIISQRFARPDVLGRFGQAGHPFASSFTCMSSASRCWWNLPCLLVKVLARSGPAWNAILPQHATDWDAADSQAEILVTLSYQFW